MMEGVEIQKRIEKMAAKGDTMHLIKHFAQMSGVTVKTLRHYEKIGLLVPKNRDDKDRRVYSEEDTKRLQTILYLKSFDFTLTQIGEILDAPYDEREQLLASQIERIDASANRYDSMLRLAKTQLSNHPDIMEMIPDPLALAKPSGTKPCLVVAGMQKDFVKGVLATPRIKRVVPAIASLVTQARKMHVPVIYLCDNHVKGIHHELEIWGDHAIAGTPGAEIIEELTPKEGDHVIYKHYYSGFYQTELRSLLGGLGADTLLMTGIHLHVCIFHTMMDAFNLGYKGVILSDATESFTQEQYQSGVTLLRESYQVEFMDSQRAMKAYLSTKY